MSKQPENYTLTPLPDGYELGPEYQAIQDAAQPQTITRLASIIAEYDGSNEIALAQRICNIFFEGEPIADE